jgi:hypothetical protein
MMKIVCYFIKTFSSKLKSKLVKKEQLTLSVRAGYIYSAASKATSPDGVRILRDFHKVVK